MPATAVLAWGECDAEGGSAWAGRNPQDVAIGHDVLTDGAHGLCTNQLHLPHRKAIHCAQDTSCDWRRYGASHASNSVSSIT